MKKVIFLMFVSFISIGLFASNDIQLFQTIKAGSHYAFSKMVTEEASVRSIDPLSKDTPLFYAIKMLLETIIYVHDSNSNVGQNSRAFFGLLSAAIPLGTLALVCYLDKKKKLWVALGGIAAMIGLGIGYGIYFGSIKDSILNRIKIVDDLLKNPQVDLNYMHEKTNQTIGNVINHILDPQFRGRIYLGGCPRYINDAYSLALNGSYYIFSESTLRQYIKPIFEKFTTYIPKRFA